MKLLRHILVVIALFAATLPCVHAEKHAHRPGEPTLPCVSHDCSCHSCDHSVCVDGLDMPQKPAGTPVAVALPSSSIQLFVFSESRPIDRPGLLRSDGVLASLQTVQLLI